MSSHGAPSSNSTPFFGYLVGKRNRLAAATEPLDPTRDGGLGDRRHGTDPNNEICVACDLGAVARESGRLYACEVVDMGVQPLGDRREVAVDLIELNDPQRWVSVVVLEQCLEILCGREVFEAQRALTAVLTPQHTISVPAAVLLVVNACHNT
ncbi:hypothetical protein [Mycobacterium sp. Marseille-P9652]|uniref:hypothetical protein n=1 Tax=Mycobacterium sp. Marseille-P9652 TaxID=2654950 RepID=UPI0012E92239|nr:hypothetical protein [Mycobacterium sp. Marseille-P9652]